MNLNKLICHGLIYGLLIIQPGLTIFCNAQGFIAGEKTLNYFDSTRHKPVKTELWYPSTDTLEPGESETGMYFILEPVKRDANISEGKHPLVMISHGTGGNRFSLAWLAICLAKNGYIVAAPDHWGNTFDNKIPEYFIRYWERPQDISFVISRLLEDPELSELIDTTRIGAIGYSLGGYTVLALSGVEINCRLLKESALTEEGKREFNIPEMGDLTSLIQNLPCDSIGPLELKDNRIKAFVAMAPALGLGINSTMQTLEVKDPLLIIGAANDQIAPPESNSRRYYMLIPHSSYFELESGTGHYVFLNVPDKNLRSQVKTYYMDEKQVDRQAVHDKINELCIEFMNTNLLKE